MLEVGLKNEMEFEVTSDMSAKNAGSGKLQVLSTPSMIALMELVSLRCVDSHLEEGQSTVGTYVGVHHRAGSPVGAKIKVKSELREIDRRKLVFDVIAEYDGKVIGDGVHERFIIDNKKFLNKVEK